MGAGGGREGAEKNQSMGWQEYLENRKTMEFIYNSSTWFLRMKVVEEKKARDKPLVFLNKEKEI